MCYHTSSSGRCSFSVLYFSVLAARPGRGIEEDILGFSEATGLEKG
jgi:hypothetical protein